MDVIPHGSPVLGYLRNSTDQQIHSRADQTKVIGHIVEEFDLDLVCVFSDDGVSGSTIHERAGLQNLLAQARQTKAKYLLIQDPSRLSRGGQQDFWTIIRELRQAGIMVYSCQNRLFVTEANGPIFAIEASQAHGFNVKHSFNITRTLIESVQTRKNDPGRVPPFGYDRMRYDAQGKPAARVRYYPNGTKAEIDPDTGTVRNVFDKSEDFRKPKSQRVGLVSGAPEQVATLKRIFALAKTTGFAGIADIFNQEGLPGPRGNKWSSSSIRDILRNPVYTGAVVHGSTTKAKYHRIYKDRPQQYDFLQEGNLNQVDVPEEDRFQEADRHEALIPPDEWSEVQATLKRRSRRQTRTPRSKKRTYILSGLARCARCGAGLHGHTQRGKKGEEYPRYSCATARRNGVSQCARYSVPGPELEERVLKEVREYFTADCCKASLREGLERQLAERERGRVRVTAKKKELAALEAKKQGLFDQLTPDQLATFKGQIDQLAQNERRLKRELSELEREEGAQEDKAAFIERAMKFYEENVLALKGGCGSALREGLLALGTEVFWDPDKQEGGLRIYPFGHSANG